MPVSVANRFPDLRTVALQPAMTWTLSIASAASQNEPCGQRAGRHVDPARRLTALYFGCAICTLAPICQTTYPVDPGASPAPVLRRTAPHSPEATPMTAPPIPISRCERTIS
jgi:hypothetical protein